LFFFPCLMESTSKKTPPQDIWRWRVSDLLVNDFLLGLIDQEEQSTFSTNGKIQISISIDIHHWNLDSPTCAGGIVHHMANPFDALSICSPAVFIPVN